MVEPLENPQGPVESDPEEVQDENLSPPTPEIDPDALTAEDEAAAAELMAAPTPGLDDDEEPDADSPEAQDVPAGANPVAETVSPTPEPDDEITQDDLRRLAELGTPDLDGDDNPLNLPDEFLDPEEEEDQYDAEGAVDALAQRVAGIDQDLTDLIEEWE
ncbi:MAG: hypothetical protein IMZ62_08085, partial [Chloroflexi bacterium]|nr:hypothetical protein [Chloroflexota bacterium]